MITEELVAVHATFTVDLWDDQDQERVDDVATGWAVVEKTYDSGDLIGTATGRLLTTQAPGGSAYLAQESVTATVAGRTGTFVLHHGATKVGDADPVTWAAVVEGSGTAGLTGITGRGTLGHGTLDLEVAFPS